MDIIIVLIGAFLIALFPAWLGLYVYDHVAVQLGWATLDITFFNVFCITVLLALAKTVFSKN